MTEWDVIVEELISEMYLIPVDTSTTVEEEGASGDYYYDSEQEQYFLTDSGFNIIMAAVDAMEGLSTEAATVLGSVPNTVVTVVKQQLRQLGLVDGGYGLPETSEGSDGEDTGGGRHSNTPPP